MKDTECPAALVDALHREKAELLDNYRRLLALLGRVVAGEVAADRVRVDLGALTWALMEAEPKGVAE